MGIFLNLIILSTGIGVSWKYGGLAGLIPLGVFLTYHSSTALARTAGGRYLVPVDWVVLLYFSLGVIQIIFWVFTLFRVDLWENPAIIEGVKPFSFKMGVLTLIPFFLFVFGMLALENVIPQRYPSLIKEEVLEKVIQTGVLEQTDFSTEELKTFLEQPNAQAFYGMMLYPRFYRINQGEHTAGEYSNMAFMAQAFPRLGFKLIGPFGQKDVSLPHIHIPGYFPHAADLITIGCKDENERFHHALMVVVLGENPVMYLREPGASLKCPLPDPVCENNKTCK
jgi:hypothetical protein